MMIDKKNLVKLTKKVLIEEYIRMYDTNQVQFNLFRTTISRNIDTLNTYKFRHEKLKNKYIELEKKYKELISSKKPSCFDRVKTILRRFYKKNC